MVPCLFDCLDLFLNFLRKKEERRKKKDNSPLLELLGFAATKNKVSRNLRSFRPRVEVRPRMSRAGRVEIVVLVKWREKFLQKVEVAFVEFVPSLEWRFESKSSFLPSFLCRLRATPSSSCLEDWNAKSSC